MPKFGKKRYKISDFHPMRKAGSIVNMSEIHKYTVEMAEHLPKQLEPEEIARRWRKYVDGASKSN